MSFIQPFLLAALPLISLPIIIHLINRLRFKRVKWAAMEFLLKSRQKNRRRVLLEQLLLLFLRICAVAAIAALIAARRCCSAANASRSTPAWTFRSMSTMS